MPQLLTPAEFLRGEIYWLLEIRYASRTYRFATRAVDIADDDGVEHHYEGGLVVGGFEQAFSLFDEGSGPQSVSFNGLVFPDDIAELESLGHDLSSATGELSLWCEGRTYEERQVMLKGRVDTPAFGGDGEPVSFSLREDPALDQALWPPPTAQVNKTTWPNHDPAVTGRTYPWVFGAPGMYTEVDGTSGKTCGSPGLLLDTRSAGSGGTRYLLIAYGEVAATSVRVIDFDGNSGSGSAAYKGVVKTTDGLGQTVSVVVLDPETDLDDPSHVRMEEGHTYWIRWQDTNGDIAGAALNAKRDGYLKGGGEIVQFLLQQSTQGVDDGAWFAHAAELNQYIFAGYIDKPTRPYEFVRDEFMPLLPISVAAGPSGTYPIVWRPDAGAREAVAILTEGPELVRDGLVQYETVRLANTVRVDFAPRADSSGEFRRSVLLVGTEPDGDDPSQFATLHSRASHSRYGPTEETIPARIVYDASTAARIASNTVRARGFRRKSVRYMASWRFGWLRRGHLVKLNSDRLHFSAQLMRVRRIAYTNDGVDIELVLVPDPTLDTRA